MPKAVYLDLIISDKRKGIKMDDHSKEILDKLVKASQEGVLLYKKEKLATPTEIVNFSAVREDMFYDLEFIVKDEDGKLKEMWFGEDKKKPKG